MSLPTFTTPEVHKKGWGEELWLANTDYCGKLLKFNSGAEFSTHFHDKKAESFYILSGQIRLFWKNPDNGRDWMRDMRAGEVVHIPRLCVHRVQALTDAVIIEVSTHHEDSDSYRVAPGDSQKVD